ncbi:MAG: hypothetical protein RR234_04265 [Christensenella sp.]
MENTLFRKDYLRIALQFTYILPWGVKVKAMKEIPIKMISVYCKPDFEDNLQFSYSLLNEKAGELFFDAFDDTPLANASTLNMRDVERIVHQRITEGLSGSTDMQLKRSTLYAIGGYRIPKKVAGTKNVRLLCECYSPNVNEYTAKTTLYVKGVDLGTIDKRTLYGIDMTFLNFCERADVIIEAILQDNFHVMVEQMLQAKNNAKCFTDTPDSK